MPAYFTLQDPVTLQALGMGGSFAEIILHESRWLDRGENNFCFINAQIYGGDASFGTGGSFLVAETAMTREGPWTVAQNFLPSSSPQELVLSATMPFSQAQRLQRYVRWRWVYENVAATTYFVSFQMRAALKP
ncbi:MAG: hypothetical protein IV100_35215 [Myxococcales bacterium]|nr:hypothetical protein [Myxococcales bacterium]